MKAIDLAANAAPTFFGLRLYEVLTLAGIVIGPISAVIITLVVESVRAKREQRMRVLRMLLSTYKVAGDANWSVGMNLLLIEFAKYKKIMAARREYMSLANRRPAEGDEDAQREQLAVKQIAVVYQTARAMGYNITEGEIKTEAYISQGMVDRYNIFLDLQKAMRDLATAQTRMLELTEAAIKRQQALGQR